MRLRTRIKLRAIRRETRVFAHQEAAELYGLRNTAPHDAAQKDNGFRIYAEGKLRKIVFVSTSIRNV